MGEVEKEREREGGNIIFSVLCMLSQFQAVHFMREYIRTLYMHAGSYIDEMLVHSKFPHARTVYLFIYL